MKTRTTLMLFGLILTMLVMLGFAPLGVFLVSLPLLGGGLGALLDSPRQLSPHQRPQRPAGPGWYWNRALSKWGRRPECLDIPPIEDGIDAAVAAWKTVYGEDLGYNPHAVTLGMLERWYTKNILTSEQLADAVGSLEWVTWALTQPKQGRQERKRPGLRPQTAQVRAAYAKDVAHFTNMAQPSRVVKVEGCDGCRQEVVHTDCGECRTYTYCDGSHTRERRSLVESLADI
jgi:hypothetical protein